MKFKLGDTAKLLNAIEYDFGDDYLYIPAGTLGKIVEILDEELVDFDPLSWSYRAVICFDYELEKVEA